MENRIIKSILSLIVAVPFMAFAHTTITSPYGTDEIVLIPKLIEEHWSTNSSSFQEFELCSKQHPAETRKTINMRMRFWWKAALWRLFWVKEYSK